MRITGTKTYLKNGIEYLEKTYSNGTVVVEAMDSEDDKIKTSNKPEPILTEQEEAILNTAINTEYLVCLAELGL